MGQIKIANTGQILVFTPGDTFLDVMLREKVDINYSCGGMGSCTTCRIIIDQGVEKLEPRNEPETERAEERHFTPNERLSCQTECRDGVVFTIPQRPLK